MSKTLLTEREIRKFMKLSNLTPLRETFLTRLEEQELADEEGAEAPEGEEMGGEEMEMGGEEPAPEEDAEPAGEDEGMEAAVEQVVSAVVDALKDLPGAPDISMETEEGGEEMEMGGEMDMGMGAGEEGGEEEGGEEEEAMMESLANAGIYLEEDFDLMHEDDDEDAVLDEWLYEQDDYESEEDPDAGLAAEAYLDEDELVNEVTRRVGSRLLRRLRR